MNTSKLYPLINEAGRNHDWAVSEYPQYFTNLATTCPIVWFGDLKSNTPKIITFGSNPSDKEFLDGQHQLLKRPRFPKFFNQSLNVTATNMYPTQGIAQIIEEDDNDYFNINNNPYMSWFRPIHNFAKEYFGDECCIHIDALPFATSQKFTTLQRNTVSASSNPHFPIFSNVLEWGADFARRLLEEIVNNNDVRGIVLVGGENIRQFKSIFKPNIINLKKGVFIANRKYNIEKMVINLGSKTIEVIGTSIYLPNPYGQINLNNLVAAIKKL